MRTLRTRTLGAEMALLAVPAEAAQGIADRLVQCGIEAILDFSPAGVTVPRPITVRSMHMASELEILSYAITNR